MLRIVGRESRIGYKSFSPLHRSFSYRIKRNNVRILPKRRILPSVLGVTAIAAGGCGWYLYKSSSIQILEFAKDHATSPTDNLRWRDAVASALIDFCSQEHGREILIRHHWGSTLGSWIIEDSVCTDYIIHALLTLSEKDPRFLREALQAGKTKLITKLRAFDDAKFKMLIKGLVLHSHPITHIDKPKGLLEAIQTASDDSIKTFYLWLLSGCKLTSIPYSSIPVPDKTCPRSMRIRYCKILQNVKMEEEEDSWLTPLENISSITDSGKQSLTRTQQIRQYFGKIWKLLRPSMLSEPSADWLVLEAERPTKITTKMKNYFRKIHSTKNNPDENSIVLKEWLDTLVFWMSDSEETVATEALMALYHATSNGAALVYLSSVALQPLLKLCERTTQFKSLQQRRVISLLTERISLVPPEGEEDEYCFDRQRSTTKRVVEMVNEDVVPMEVEEIQSDSEKWRQCIVFWCFQKDVVQRKAGIRTLCNYIQRSNKQTEMIQLWTECLLDIMKPQCDPTLAKEAQGYLNRAVTKANGRDWWAVRCCLRALSLYASDEEMGEQMMQSGIIPILQVLSNSDNESINVQICRILSSMSIVPSVTGRLTREFISKYLKETLEKWEHSDLTKLQFYSKRVLYNNRTTKEQLGDNIFVLYEDEPVKKGKGEPDWDVDIVFIHGLRGCFFKTWREHTESTDFSHCVCWPEQYLPGYLKASRPERPLSIRILSVDYPAAMKPSATPLLALSFQQYARFIRGELVKAGVGNRPVVFVVHSMGGIIIKEIMIKEYMDDLASPLLYQTKGIVFYSTPHKGSPIVKWNKTTLEKILGFSPVVSQLKAFSPELQALNKAFLDIHPLPPIISINETNPIHVAKGLDLLVVPPEYGKIEVGEFYALEGKDHHSICKPHDKLDPSFTIAAAFIQRVLDGVDPSVAQSVSSDGSKAASYHVC